MESLGVMMRSLEILRLSQDIRRNERETRRCRRYTMFQKSSNFEFGNFTRRFQKRRNSADVEKILAKYSYYRNGNSPRNVSTVVKIPENVKKSQSTTAEKIVPTHRSNKSDDFRNYGKLNSDSCGQIDSLCSEINQSSRSANVSEYISSENKPITLNRIEECEDVPSMNQRFAMSTPCLTKTNLYRNESKHFKTQSIFVNDPIDDLPSTSSSIYINNNTIYISKNRPSPIFNSDSGSYECAKKKDLTTLRRFKIWWKPKLKVRDIFERWIKWKRKKVVVECDPRIQEVDDSFFEKFGSLLRQSSAKAAHAESTPLAPLYDDEVVNETITEEEVPLAELDGSRIESRFGEADDDSGIEATTDPDSETDDNAKNQLYEEVVGWNIDELYKEILYEILNNVGCDVSVEIGQLPLLAYVQDAFKIPNDKHQELLSDAETREPPEILLNVEVVEAKELQPKDPNGLSDPYVTMFLMSNKTQRYNTSVKTATLNPTWEEHISLPVLKNPQDDTLCLEVWDFDPAETVKEKMSKIFDVKGVKGLGKLMKEIAVTASTGKHDDELIGRANIPLKTIPASGMLMWYSLDKKSKSKRGVIKIHLKFSSEKNPQVAIQEHRHLLRVLLMHELENSKVARYWWAGTYSLQAEAIITQHATQSGLSQNNVNLSQWIVFCTVHSEYPLSFALFNKILDRMSKTIQNNLEDLKLFWDGARKILPSCFSIVRKIRKKHMGDKNVLKLLRESLMLMQKLSTMPKLEDFDLIPADKYQWLYREKENAQYTILDVLERAVYEGACAWFNDIVDTNEGMEKTDEGNLQFLIKTIQLVRSDLQRAVEYYDICFAETISFPYSKSLYTVYEKKISEIIEPIVMSVCKSLKQLRYNDESSHNHVKLANENGEVTQLGAPDIKGEPLAMGTALFELYLVLQRFLGLGKELCPVDWSNLSISKFYVWFYGGVAQWLDIAVFKALTRIEKAVELDQLVTVDETVQHSSSAVDTLAIFYQIKVFWDQLAWPDVEGSYSFVAKIVDDICRCCVFYADKMSQRVEGMGQVSTVYDNKFHVTTEWCLAINNIDYCQQHLQAFVNDLGVDGIIKSLGEIRTPIEAERCQDTIHNVLENSLDTIRNKIIELLEMVVDKMIPSISRYLLEGAEVLHQDCNSMNRVFTYLEENLNTLHAHLSEDNFTRTLEVIWGKLGVLLLNLINSNLERRRPPSFFSNLHQCLKIMIQSFKQDKSDLQLNETLDRIHYLLKLHGFETSDLIHQYYIERWEDQKNITESQFGMLSVRAIFCDSAVKIEVINARNLLPMDSNGSVDSFVRINLLPEDIFAGTIRPKTQTHNKNLFPLFEETFSIILTPEQRNYRNGLIVFNVKDKDMFGMSNQYLAEGFLHFSEIPDTANDITSLPQVHIKLSRPTKLDGDAIKSLEHRIGDKQAKDFLKKQKQRIGLPH